MNSAQKALAALEAACRKAWNKPHSILQAEFVESDLSAHRYGPTTSEIQRHAGPGVTMYMIRSALYFAASQGRVMSCQRHARGQICWWPVGMYEKLQQERAAQKLCTACRGEGVIHTGILEAPVTQCRKCDGDGLEGGAK